MEFRKNYQTPLRVQWTSDKPSMTKQAFKDEADINNILNRYAKTGIISNMNSKPGTYGDFSNVEDYQTAIACVHRAEEAFAELPAKVRSRFQNNPSAFLAFMEDPKNVDEMVSLGLVTRKEIESGTAPVPPDTKPNP